MSTAEWTAGPEACHKTIAGAAETAYFDGRSRLLTRRQGRVATPEMALSGPILIKRYDNRRLYRPDAGAYLTLDDLAAMVEDDEPFTVREAGTGEDITPSILKQIIRKRALHG